MATQSLEQFSSLVELIYDAALDARLWPKVVDRVRLAVDGSGAMMLTALNPVDAGGFLYPANLPPDFPHEYARRFQAEDLLVQRGLAMQLPSGSMVTDEDLIPLRERDRPEVKRFFDNVHSMGIGRLFATMIFGADAPIGTLVTSFAAYRGVGSTPFPEHARPTMQLLLPHLSRSAGIMYRLRDAEYKVATSLAALDRLAAAIVLLDVRGCVLFANRAAATILHRNDGPKLEREPGASPRLKGATSSENRKIDAAIAMALQRSQLNVPHFSQGVSVARPSGAPPVVLNVSALPVSNEFDTGPKRPLAIVFLTDTAAPAAVDAMLLCDLYGLTKTEAEIVGGLCAGKTLKNIAATRGTSEATLRTQVKSALRKTGASRQHELVKLAMSLSSGTET